MSELPADAALPGRSPGDTLRLYLDITRPRVLALVVFTACLRLLLGRSAWPDAWTAFWVLTVRRPWRSLLGVQRLHRA